VTAREAVLARVRAAVGDVPVVPEVPRAYRTVGSRSRDEVVALFVERVRDYRAVVVVTDESGKPALGFEYPESPITPRPEPDVATADRWVYAEEGG